MLTLGQSLFVLLLLLEWCFVPAETIFLLHNSVFKVTQMFHLGPANLDGREAQRQRWKEITDSEASKDSEMNYQIKHLSSAADCV